MNKYFLIIVSIAAALAGCSKDSEMTESPVTPMKNNMETVAKQPVQFGAYVNRTITRAGDPGVLVTSNPAGTEISLQEKGFGVMAYYTDDDQYSPIYVPNFMYNTKVTYKSTVTPGVWTYEPLQYWPNETGENAVSESVDRLSFFAYAPYVDVTNSTGIVTGGGTSATSGIVALSRNGAVGDPFVKYYVDLDPSQQVDFCWATPQIDKTKPGVGTTVDLHFNHALAALNVQIDALFDVVNHPDNLDDEKNVDANTKIYVRSVTFEGFVTKGSFNLNTTRATWYDLAGENYIDGGSVTVYDGRTNGREGQSVSPNEAPLGLNAKLVQSQPYTGTPTVGVTKTAVNLFDSNDDPEASIFVIPSGQPLRVSIVYDVETIVPELPGYLSDGVTHGTSVENKITKTITLSDSSIMRLEAGKTHTLKLHLGMTSVKFDASVSDWGDSTSSGTNLPINTSSLGTITLTNGSTTETSTTVWIGETTVAKPTVTVKDDSGADIDIDKVTISWESNNENVATVNANGEITLVDDGVAIIEAKATYGGVTKSAYYTVNVNKVTGITFEPVAVSMATGGKTSVLKVKIAHSTNEPINLPDELDVELSKNGVVSLSVPTKTTSGGVTTYQYTVTSNTTEDTVTATFKLNGPNDTTTVLTSGSVDITVASVLNPTGTGTGNGFTNGWDQL